MDIVLERSRETVVSETFTEFNDKNKESREGKLISNLTQFLPVLLGRLRSVMLFLMKISFLVGDDISGLFVFQFLRHYK